MTTASAPTCATWCASWRVRMATSRTIVLCRPDDVEFIRALGSRFEPMVEQAGNYSLREQLSVPLRARARPRQPVPCATLRRLAADPLPVCRHHSRLHPPAVSAVPRQTWRALLRADDDEHGGAAGAQGADGVRGVETGHPALPRRARVQGGSDLQRARRAPGSAAERDGHQPRA